MKGTQYSDLRDSDFEKYGIKANCLIMMDVWGRYFQCVKTEREYIFIPMGSQLKGLDIQGLLTLDACKKFRADDKKHSFFASISEINKCKYNFSEDILNPLGGGTITLYIGKKKMYFNLSSDCNEKVLELFFDKAEFVFKLRLDASAKEERVPKHVSSAKYKTLKTVNYAIHIVMAVILVLFIFSDRWHRPCFFALTACFVLTLLLYIRFQDVFVFITERRKKEDEPERRYKVPCGIPLFAIPTLMLVKMLSFEYLSIGNVFIFVFIFSAAFILPMCFLIRECGKKRVVIASFIAIGLIFGFALTLNANYVFDSAEPSSSICTVSKKHIITSSDSPDSYELTVADSNGNQMTFDVSKSFYAAISIGDIVTVRIYAGALGIPYGMIAEDDRFPMLGSSSERMT